MARLESFQKQAILATAGLSPQAIAPALAAFARQELANVIADGTGIDVYDIYVNGRRGALESSVEPPGPILYDFIWWQEIATYALQYCIERSPEYTGQYKRNWFVRADGRMVANPAQIDRASVVEIVNDLPYHRKIDVGHMKMRVPHQIIEDAKRAVMRTWGNVIQARRKMIMLPNGYILKGRFSRGFRKKARTKLRSDTQAGAAMQYPALVMNMR